MVGSGLYVRRRGARSRRALVAAILLTALLGALTWTSIASAGSGPPVNTVAPSIGGAQAKEGNTVKAKEGTWTGETPIKFTFRWERLEHSEWVKIVGATEVNYVVVAADVGKHLRFTVTAANNVGNATKTSPESELVAGVPPRNEAPPMLNSTEPKEGQLLETTAGKWGGTPVAQYTYVWESCGLKKCTVLSEQPPTTQAHSSYRVPSGHELVGLSLRVTVTAENGFTPKGSATTAETQPVKAGPPVDEVAPKITGEAREGQELTVSNGTWWGTPTEFKFSYQWSSCTIVGGCMPIAGAIGTSYRVGPSEVSGTIEVTVTAKNSVGTTPANAETGVVSGNQPANTVRPTLTGEAREGQTLTAHPGTWTGTPPPPPSATRTRGNAVRRALKRAAAKSPASAAKRLATS
jgi:hypothetical protein